MKKTTIPGTKIIKAVAGKNPNEEKPRKDLEKIGKIELLGKTLKNVFSLYPTLMSPGKSTRWGWRRKSWKINGCLFYSFPQGIVPFA